MNNLQVIVIVAIAILWINISNSEPVTQTYQQQIDYSNHGLTRKEGNGEVAEAKNKDHLDDNVMTDDVTIGQKKATPNILGHDTDDVGISNLTRRRTALRQSNSNSNLFTNNIEIKINRLKKKKLLAALKSLSSYSNLELLSALHDRLNQRDGVPLKGKWRHGRDCGPWDVGPGCREYFPMPILDPKDYKIY